MDLSVALGRDDPKKVPDGSVRCAGGDEQLAPGIHRHQHLRQVVGARTSDGNRNLPVAADAADGLV